MHPIAAFCRRNLNALGLELYSIAYPLLPKDRLDPSVFIDSLDVLAYRTIVECGKRPIDFPAFFSAEKEICHDI